MTNLPMTNLSFTFFLTRLERPEIEAYALTEHLITTATYAATIMPRMFDHSMMVGEAVYNMLVGGADDPLFPD